jgi:hypothetical protein
VYFKSDGKFTGAGFDFDFFVPGSIDENGLLTDISIHPNPSDGRFTVFGELTIERILKVEVFNATGTRVRKEEFYQGPGTIQYELDLSGCQSGIYLLKLSGDGLMKTEKLIITE